MKRHMVFVSVRKLSVLEQYRANYKMVSHLSDQGSCAMKNGR